MVIQSHLRWFMVQLVKERFTSFKRLCLMRHDHVVQDLLRDAKRRQNGDLRASRVLELQDDMGFTALLAAAAKGHVQCVNLVRTGSGLGCTDKSA